MATWYVVENNQQVGPLDDATFAQWVKQGRIQASTLVWNEAMTAWLPYDQARAASVQRQAEALATGGAGSTVQDAPAPLRTAAASHAVASATILCAECGRSFSAEAVVPINGQWVCADCRPVALHKLREGAGSLTAMAYAGFWIRFAAKLIDGVILFVVNLLVGFCTQGGFATLGSTAAGTDGPLMLIAVFAVTVLVQLAIGLCYTVIFLGRFAATPGKMACGLIVVRADGSPVTYARAAGRHFADMLSGLTLCVGYLIAAFDPEKRALHDYICDTRVVYR